MSAHCPGCGAYHEEDDHRLCSTCEVERKVSTCKHELEVSPSGQLAACKLCSFIGKWRDGFWERISPATSSTPLIDFRATLRASIAGGGTDDKAKRVCHLCTHEVQANDYACPACHCVVNGGMVVNG